MEITKEEILILKFKLENLENHAYVKALELLERKNNNFKRDNFYFEKCDFNDDYISVNIYNYLIEENLYIKLTYEEFFMNHTDWVNHLEKIKEEVKNNKNLENYKKGVDALKERKKLYEELKKEFEN